MASPTEKGSQRAFKQNLFKQVLADLEKLTLSKWMVFTMIGLSIAITSLVFLWPNPVEFPMDDTYIHFVYAKNLSEQRLLMFNEPGEIGVGTSSLLWVLLLAGGIRIGIPIFLLAKILGITSLMILGMGIYLLLRPICSSLPALAASLFVVLSGHLLWFALSGMETILFLALGIFALLSYRDQRWGWLGVLLGLLTLTRLEGILLGVAIGIVDIWRYRKIRCGLCIAGFIGVLFCGPWVVYLVLRTGHALPTSGIGKHFSQFVSLQIAADRVGGLAFLKTFPELSFPIIWFLYTLEFILGGAALPLPYININPIPGPFNIKLSVWALVMWITVVIPLLWISFGQLIKFLKRPVEYKDGQHVLLIIFLLWVLLHNLSYLTYLPMIGTASRYVALNHIGLWVTLVAGLWLTGRRGYKVWLAGGLFTLALANTVYWNSVYDANLDHMRNVRIAAANYLGEKMPQDYKCAATDVGVLRYYSKRATIDLGGLIDPSMDQRFLDGDLDHYLVEKGVTCLVLPGRIGATDDGFYDIAQEMGFIRSRLFSLQPKALFQINHERWLLGYLPVMNYQATVSIYQLNFTQDLAK